MEAARSEAGFETMEKYIRQRHNTVAQYIATRSLLDLCEETDNNTGEQVGMWWWEQVGIDLAGARETEAKVVEVEKGGIEE